MGTRKQDDTLWVIVCGKGKPFPESAANSAPGAWTKKWLYDKGKRLPRGKERYAQSRSYYVRHHRQSWHGWRAIKYTPE